MKATSSWVTPSVERPALAGAGSRNALIIGNRSEHSGFRAHHQRRSQHLLADASELDGASRHAAMSLLAFYSARSAVAL